MLKDGQAVMGLKIYEKEATRNKHVKVETKQTKIRVLGKYLRTQPCLWHACVGLVQNPNP